MKRKHLGVVILFTLGVAGLSMLRVNQFSELLGLEEYEQFISVTMRTVIFLTAGLWLVKKLDLKTWGGFKNPANWNYWMLLIPLIYPAILSYSHISLNCAGGIAYVVFVRGLIPGLIEEIAFRGIVQGYLIKKHVRGPYHGIVLLTSALFALCHLTNLRNSYLPAVANQVVYAFIMSLLFSAIHLRVNNIWLLGIVHGILNIVTGKCSSQDEIIVKSQSLLDYLANIGNMVMIMLPVLVTYWFLMKNVRHVNDKSRAQQEKFKTSS